MNPRPSDDRHNTLQIASLNWSETSEVSPIKVSSDAGQGFVELLWKRNLPSPAVRATCKQRLVNTQIPKTTTSEVVVGVPRWYFHVLYTQMNRHSIPGAYANTEYPGRPGKQLFTRSCRQRRGTIPPKRRFSCSLSKWNAGVVEGAPSNLPTPPRLVSTAGEEVGTECGELEFKYTLIPK